ncbi:MAG: glycogen synthase GlgA [Candidatus Omnitrophica bacterium]|nr:glycogen synthase GlgA [Candidatus Omnitrophota bacterium]MBU1924520.1 glycogen synthase GlgA [Candidatus Omnitrophota bacterium]
MKIVFCSSEVVPFAKTGGLADVAGTLPLALEECNQQVVIILPLYAGIDRKKFNIEKVQANVYTAKLGRSVTVYFIENEKYFGRGGLYQDKGIDFSDNLERFAYYCKQTLEVLKKVKFKPDIIHCHDWQSALIPVYLKTLYREDAFYKKTKTVFTIHNLGYQGLSPREQFPKTGLDWSLFTLEGLEFYGKVNLLKGGLLFADKITTVSPTYAREIQTKEFGCGLEGAIIRRRKDLVGILNGINYKEWDPQTNSSLAKNYSIKNIKDKIENKLDLQKVCSLKIDKKAPLLGMITRLADQKGLDIFAEIAETLFKLPLQFVLLGTGEPKYHTLFEKVQKKYKNTAIQLKFDATLAYKIYAGSDMFVMPSHYEPCGLGQLISLKFGTVPIVRKTGGLADTVIDYTHDENSGNGFVFEAYSSDKLLDAITRSLDVYKDKPAWHKLMKTGMKSDFSWKQSAKDYLKLYKELKAHKE